MNTHVEYPVPLKREALRLIQAARRNPCKETAAALDEFMERSPMHSDCVIAIDGALTVLRNRIAQGVVDTQDPEARRAVRWVPSTLAAGVAGLAIVAAALWVWYSQLPKVHQSGPTHEVLLLSDGSRVNLFPHSRVAVDESDDARRLELLEGGLAVKAQHDAARPLYVETPRKERIVALGTQFAVLLQTSGTSVSLEEGRLRVSSARESKELVDGEVTTIDESGNVKAPEQKAAVERPMQVESLKNVTLSEIAAAFNKVNTDPQIEVTEEPGQLYDVRLNLADPEEWITELLNRQSVEVQRHRDLITFVTITPRK